VADREYERVEISVARSGELAGVGSGLAVLACHRGNRGDREMCEGAVRSSARGAARFVAPGR
jgi:hypothetical protein